MKFILIAFVALFAAVSPLSATSLPPAEFQSLTNPQLLQAARQISCIGPLKQADDNSIYIQVSQEYITRLFPMIPQQQLFDGFAPSQDPRGACIEVITKEEMRQAKIKTFQALGRALPFRVIDFCYAPGLTAASQKLVLIISAPLISELRRKYNLPPKITRFGKKPSEFYIT